MSSTCRCPDCGAPLIESGAICPRCLLATGLETSGPSALGPGFLDNLPLPGDVLVIADKYRVIELIGRGAMGVVYKAQQENLDRLVAVKMLQAGVLVGEQDRQRFLREAKSAAGLKHPNIVTIHDWGEHRDQPYISMEYVEGRSLGAMVQDGPLDPITASRLVKKAAVAVEYAHQMGIVHRDIKPSNILLDVHGEPKVADFGLAKRVGERIGELEAQGTETLVSGATADRAEDFTDLSLAGQIMGTPGYLAPEQAGTQFGAVGPRCDIYALGAVLYHLLTGRPPFVGVTVEETLRQTADRDPMALRALNPGVPADLETICLKCLQKEPARRYSSAQALADDLARWERGEPILARPVSRTERMLKWVRRHPAIASLSVTLLIAVMGGSGLVLWQWQRASLASRSLSDSFDLLQLKTAERYFEDGDSRSAFAYLADLLRRNPDDRLAAERAVSALMHRDLRLVREIILQHQSKVNSASFSPDGLRVVTAAKDGTARVWDAHTGQPLGQPLRHESTVWSASFSPDGLRVVTASEDNTARVWNAHTGQPLGLPLRHEGDVISVSFSNDGLSVVTTSWEDNTAQVTAQVWDARTGQPLGQPLRHDGRVMSASFSPDGLLVLTASDDGTARLWDARTGQPLGEPLRHDHIVYSASFSPDGLRVLTASLDGTARVWDVHTGQPLGQPLRDESMGWAASFSPDGLRVVTASDGTARVWDVHTGQPLGQPLRHESTVRSASFSPDGLRVVTASEDGTARVWDARTCEQLGEPLRHESTVISASFSADSLRVVTASEDSTARVWDTYTSRSLGEPLRHEQGVLSASFSWDGLRVVTASADRTAQVWDAHEGQLLGEPLRHGEGVVSASFSSDGLRVVTVSADGSAGVWDAHTGQPLGQPLGPENSVRSASFSPDGLHMVTASEDGTVQMWDARTGQALGRPFRHESDVYSASFSQDGLRLVTASEDGTARVWDARTLPFGQALRHGLSVTSASFSPDGLRVVTASLDSTARVWDARTGQPFGEPLRHGQGVLSASFSSDGLRVVTASLDSTARVWDARTGIPLGEPLRHARGVAAASFSPDGLRVVTASEDSTARVWDARTGQPLGEPFRHGRGIVAASFSSDGLRVVTTSVANSTLSPVEVKTSADNTARVWTVPTARSAAPGWFPDLLEAVGGARLESGVVRPGSSPQNHTTRDLGQFEKSVDGETNVFSIVATWLLSDRATRTISPFSSTTIPTYVERLVELGTLESLQEAIRLEPANGLAYARLARSEWTGATTVVSKGQSEFLSHYALKLTSQLPEVWTTRIFLLDAAGHPDQSLLVASNATVRFPENGAVWYSLGRILAQTNQLEDSLAALTKAVDLTANGAAQRTSHTEALEERAEVFRRLGRQTEADRDVRDAKGIPVRQAEAAAALLDLTRFYNASMMENWHNTNDVGNNLAELPTGLQEFGGIRWDVRGIIQLDSVQVAMTAPGYPKEVLGIAVGQRGLRLHFLHGCGWPGNEGELVARYIIHYADGTSVEAPVVYGRDLRNWQFWPEMPESERSGGEVAWKGSQKRWEQFYPDWGVRLYRMTWENPHPEKEIATIDLVSAMQDTAVFIIAITADPVDLN